MTAPDERPDERGQRVSRAVSVFEAATGPKRTFDPVEAAAELGEPNDDPVRLRATIAALTAEIARLREALATQRSDRRLATLREAVTFLHKRAAAQRDGRATGILNGAALALGEYATANRALAPAKAEGKSDEG